MKRVVVVPTYNERENVAVLVPQVRELGYEILIVDDPGGDDTAALVAELAAQDEGVHLLVRPKRDGYATALVEGLQWALANGYEQVGQMDADLNHDPATLPVMFRSLDDFDLAIGSRYVFGGRTPDWSARRRLLSRLAGWSVTVLLKLPVADPTSGFRTWRASTLRRIDWSRMESSGFIALVEILFLAWQEGATCREVPIVFRQREAGQSKMTSAMAREGLAVMWKLRRARKTK